MTDRISSESDHAAISTFSNDAVQPDTGDLSRRLLADEAPPPTPGSSHDALVRRCSAGPSNITQDGSIELAQIESQRNAISQKSSEIVRRRIYWVSPALMTGAFIAGVSFAVGHHLYYESLNGQEVGDSNRQQWPLRFGNVFAFLVKTSLAASAGIACIQWLWKSLRRNHITIEGIDAAFSARDSLLSFLNWEMLSKIKIGTFIALVIWCLPLAALVTPATLSVKATYKNITTAGNVISLNISTIMLTYDDPDAHKDYIARFAELRYGTHGGYGIVGPSLHLARIISASASSGEIFQIAKPLSRPNMTYQTELHIPAIKCENSSSAVARNTTAAAVIAAGEGGKSSEPFNFSKLDMGQLEYQNLDEVSWPPMKIGYFAMIPQDDERMTRPWVSPNGLDYVDTPNQLWVVVADYGDDTRTNPRFLTCKLWNVSLSLNVTYFNDVQSVRPENFTYLNEVQTRKDWFGILEFPDQTADIANMVYSAFFWGICEKLTGYVVSSFNPPNWDLHDEANITTTTLAGASEFVAMMKNLSDLGDEDLSDEDLSDEDSLSLNRPLGALIEELSLNTSLNMLTDGFLSTLTPANVTYTNFHNEYSYEHHNLVLAYGLAIFFTLLSVLLGWSAYLYNGMSYDFTVSSIIGTSQNPDLAHLFRQQSLGAQPLDPQIAKTKLQFGIVVPKLSENSVGQPFRRAAFGLDGTVSQLQKS